MYSTAHFFLQNVTYQKVTLKSNADLKLSYAFVCYVTIEKQKMVLQQSSSKHGKIIH